MDTKSNGDLPGQSDVVIVGGGLAGLACAHALADRGLSVVVLERDRLLGGRAQSWTDEKTGHPVHIGPHIFLTAYPNMRAWLERLGTADRIAWLDDAFIDLVEGRQCHTIGESRLLPPPLHFLPSMLRDPAVSRRDLASNTRITWRALRLTEADLVELDGANALGFLRSNGVTERMIERFWTFVVMSILNVPLELCSAGAMMRFYRDIMSHGGVRMGVATMGLGDLFAPHARRAIEERGGIVRTGLRVVGFAGDPLRVDGVTLEDGRTLSARHVIAAVPPVALRGLVRPEWRAEAPFRDLDRFEPCPYVATYLWFDRKLTHRRMWARVASPGDLGCDFYDLSNLQPGWPSERSIICSNIIWAHRAADLSAEEIVARTRAEIAEFLPEAARADILHSVVNRIPMAIHCPYPGTESRRPSPRTPIPGLLLAGDWVRTGVPSCMEGAVQSGLMAAEHVLEDLGRSEPLVRSQDGMHGLARLAAMRVPRRRAAA